jgi:predicted DNA-binding ArsR family transcriptional regulator
MLYRKLKLIEVDDESGCNTNKLLPEYHFLYSQFHINLMIPKKWITVILGWRECFFLL